MDATVLLAMLLFCQSGLYQPGDTLDLGVNEPVADTPVVQNLFIEVDLTEPARIETIPDSDGTETPALDDLRIDYATKTQTPVENEADSLDQIEPLFAEEVESTMDSVIGEEPASVETTPIGRGEKVPQLLEEGGKETDTPEPLLLDEDRADPEIAGAAIVPNLDATVPVTPPEMPVESTSPAIVDGESPDGGAESLEAIEPIMLDDLTEVAEPQADGVEGQADGEATQVESPFVQPLPLIEPDFVPTARTVATPRPEIVEETAVSQVIETAEPVSEPANDPVLPTRENEAEEVSTPGESPDSVDLFESD